MLVEFTDVVLLCDVKKEDSLWGETEFHRGDVGILVDTLDGSEAAIVEFIAGAGHTLGLAPLTQADVRHLEPDEIQSTRVVDIDEDDAPDEELYASWNVLGKDKGVVLTRPVPELALLPGDQGMVLDCRPEAGEYTIRMWVGSGLDGPVITLPEEAIRLPEWYELSTVRKLHPPAPAAATAAAQTAV